MYKLDTVIILWRVYKSDFSHVQVVHFYSDGPTTQYRQKKNFFFSTILFDLGFRLGTWNFFEASHGKGAADGVGAVLKRSADCLVRQGTDMSNANIVFDKLSGMTSVKLFFVQCEDVDRANEKYKMLELHTVPGAFDWIRL